MLLLLLVQVLLLAISAVGPRLQLAWLNWTGHKLALRLPDPDELLRIGPPPVETPDSLVAQLLTAASLPPEDSTATATAPADSLVSQALHFSRTRLDPDELDTLSRNVIETWSDPAALQPFFRALADSGLVRIAHYGDSQIEGDRISQYLRAYLSRRFGGGYLGTLPFLEQASHHSLARSHSGNWRRYSIFKDRYNSARYGLSGCVFRFQPALSAEAATQLAQTGRPDSAWMRFRLAPGTRHQRVELLWSNPYAPTRLTIRLADTLYRRDTLPASTLFQATDLRIPTGCTDIALHFSGPISPDFYGLRLTGNQGIEIDNYALRGHSGNDLARISDDFILQQLQTHPVQLIIFQYGGNLVPYDVANFDWYEKDLYRMLMRFKRLAPQAALLVVGVGDAARVVEGVAQTYPTVERIRQAQRRAAERAGVPFWDLYAAMGGANSIVSWVRQGMAGADYAHFSPLGQRLAARLLYSALMKAWLAQQPPAIRFEPAEPEQEQTVPKM